MLILIKWVPERNGGLFLLSNGQTVFRSIEKLEKDYLPFIHHSPQGEEEDKEVFIWKSYFR